MTTCSIAAVFIVILLSSRALTKSIEECHDGDGNGLVKLNVSCPSQYIILVNSVESQQHNNCSEPANITRWSGNGSAVYTVWLWCNLKPGRCTNGTLTPANVYLRINYSCVDKLASIKRFDMCSNVNEVRSGPFYLQSKGYPNSYEYTNTNNCTCHLSAIQGNVTETFSVFVKYMLTMLPDKLTLTVSGKKEDVTLETITRGTDGAILNDKSVTALTDVYVAFVPAYNGSGYIWIGIKSAGTLPIAITCNAGIGTNPTLPPTTTTTTGTSTLSSSTTTSATSSSTTSSTTTTTTTSSAASPTASPIAPTSTTSSTTTTATTTTTSSPTSSTATSSALTSTTSSPTPISSSTSSTSSTIAPSSTIILTTSSSSTPSISSGTSTTSATETSTPATASSSASRTESSIASTMTPTPSPSMSTPTASPSPSMSTPTASPTWQPTPAVAGALKEEEKMIIFIVVPVVIIVILIVIIVAVVCARKRPRHYNKSEDAVRFTPPDFGVDSLYAKENFAVEMIDNDLYQSQDSFGNGSLSGAVSSYGVGVAFGTFKGEKAHQRSNEDVTEKAEEKKDRYRGAIVLPKFETFGGEDLLLGNEDENNTGDDVIYASVENSNEHVNEGHGHDEDEGQSGNEGQIYEKEGQVVTDAIVGENEYSLASDIDDPTVYFEYDIETGSLADENNEAEEQVDYAYAYAKRGRSKRREPQQSLHIYDDVRDDDSDFEDDEMNDADSATYDHIRDSQQVGIDPELMVIDYDELHRMGFGEKSDIDRIVNLQRTEL